MWWIDILDDWFDAPFMNKLPFGMHGVLGFENDTVLRKKTAEVWGEDSETPDFQDPSPEGSKIQKFNGMHYCFSRF